MSIKLKKYSVIKLLYNKKTCGSSKINSKTNISVFFKNKL